MKKYTDCPQVLRDFLAYHENIKAQSPRTISEYYLDLRMFLRFIKLMRNDMPVNSDLNIIPIKDIDIEFIRTITTSEIFDFLSYLANDREHNPESYSSTKGISPTSRSRKLSAIKSFYKYLTIRTKQLSENPVADLEYPKLRGVFLCFSGSRDMAEELLKRGWYLGFDGPITYKNAKRAPEVAAVTPLERIVVETDAPYMAPVPMRGKRNDSRYLPYVIEKLAEWKGVTAEVMTRVTWENGKRLFLI